MHFYPLHYLSHPPFHPYPMKHCVFVCVALLHSGSLPPALEWSALSWRRRHCHRSSLTLLLSRERVNSSLSLVNETSSGKSLAVTPFTSKSSSVFSIFKTWQLLRVRNLRVKSESESEADPAWSWSTWRARSWTAWQVPGQDGSCQVCFVSAG